MKATSNIRPESIQNLGNGTSYLNFNIEELDGGFNYESILINGDVTYDKIITLMIRLKYSIDDEFAINSKSMQMYFNNCTDEQRAKWMIEINEFTDYRQQCIIKAQEVCGIV